MGAAIFNLLFASLLVSQAVQAQTASASLAETERNGKKMFQQRCSVCHTLQQSNVGGQPYGPVLTATAVANEAAAREIILKGSPRMPGFQYTLEPKEIDNIVAYLKTVRNGAPKQDRD